MPNATGFKQAEHKLLVIPGPVEVSDEVLYANAHPSMSHVSPDFIPVFGDCLRMIRQTLMSKDGQPFLIAGSGTLGWDQVAANLVEPEEHVLVLNSGYFGDSFADCLETYGAIVTQVKAPLGEAVIESALEAALKEKKYKLVTFTHVDTSTGVLSNAKMIGEVVRRVSPDTLIALDGVCAVVSEEIRFDAWSLDIVLSATQKGLGVPPGLSVLLASPRAISTFTSRKSRVTSYYASWKNWLPIMKAYEEGKPAYFATPPVNLIYALRESLGVITKDGQDGIEARFAAHKAASRKFKDAMSELGLKQLAKDPEFAANGMTAIYYPEGLGAGDILPRLLKEGIVAAGGLHKECKDKYFRIGHMGISVVNSERGDIDRVIAGITKAVGEAKAEKGLA